MRISGLSALMALVHEVLRGMPTTCSRDCTAPRVTRSAPAPQWSPRVIARHSALAASAAAAPGAHTDHPHRAARSAREHRRPTGTTTTTTTRGRRQKVCTFVERGKGRLGERVERLERLARRKVHAASSARRQGSELSMSERMKRLVSAYGPLALGFHVTTEVVVCGLFYLAVDHGLDVGALLRVVESMTGTDMSTVVSSGAGTLGVAYALTVALTGIPRTFLTIAATPYIARKLGWRQKV